MVLHYKCIDALVSGHCSLKLKGELYMRMNYVIVCLLNKRNRKIILGTSQDYQEREILLINYLSFFNTIIPVIYVNAFLHKILIHKYQMTLSNFEIF